MIDVKVIADSLGPNGIRLLTLQLKYPRIILAELNTHRLFARSSASSRAIPVSKLADMALETMYEPIRYGKNQAGMQAKEENLEGEDLERAREIWKGMAIVCAQGVKQLSELGLHKQWCNRPIEWFSHVSTVLTSTEWDNFFELRFHKDAQPEFYELARQIYYCHGTSHPVFRPSGNSEESWHLPYVTDEERKSDLAAKPGYLCAISAARCARVSYNKHDGTAPSVDEDLKLFDRLVVSKPQHQSPAEHQAKSIDSRAWFGNLCGWVQFRKYIEMGISFNKI